MSKLPAPPRNCPLCDTMWSAINEHNNAYCYDCGMHWSDMEHKPPAEPGSYKQARGVFDWQEGDERAEDTIRRLRGGDKE